MDTRVALWAPPWPDKWHGSGTVVARSEGLFSRLRSILTNAKLVKARGARMQASSEKKHAIPHAMN